MFFIGDMTKKRLAPTFRGSSRDLKFSCMQEISTTTRIQNLWINLRREIDKGRNLKIVFVGTVGPGIKQSIQDAGLNDKTEYKGFLPYTQMIEEISTASYLLVCASEKRHVPGKMFEYLRSGKPFLLLVIATKRFEEY